jgi:hypothetical protein
VELFFFWTNIASHFEVAIFADVCPRKIPRHDWLYRLLPEVKAQKTDTIDDLS